MDVRARRPGCIAHAHTHAFNQPIGSAPWHPCCLVLALNVLADAAHPACSVSSRDTLTHIHTRARAHARTHTHSHTHVRKRLPNDDQVECGDVQLYCPAGSSIPIPVDEGYYTVPAPDAESNNDLNTTQARFTHPLVVCVQPSSSASCVCFLPLLRLLHATWSAGWLEGMAILGRS